ncbi:MAG: HNH endonuclease [Motilibacteraceae bacterium]
MERLAGLVGDALLIEKIGDGWPALGTIEVVEDPVPVALFVGRVGLSHRGRDAVERRFQNPGKTKPIVPVNGRRLVLVGLWSEDPLVPIPQPIAVTADAARRLDHHTRWSAFVPLATLGDAQVTGWATSLNTNDELVRCMHPALLPAAVAADLGGAEPDVERMGDAAVAAGLLDGSGEGPARDRARRAATALVRDARFSRRVLDAYDRRCAMCGLGLSLVQGAHIYPASAPGSPDEPWNGISLCANHHAAFDRHLVAVEPETHRIVFRDDVAQQAAEDAATAALLQGTFEVLATGAPAAAPRAEMLRRRYQHYEEQYAWLPW